MRKILLPGFVLYLVVIIVLLTVSFSGTGFKLNKYFLGIRIDHFIHAVIFIPFMVFCRLIFKQTNFFIPFFLGIFFCSVCESLHYFLPYRQFSLYDYYANLTGLTLGASAYLFRK